MKLRIKKDQEQKTGVFGNNKGAKFYINFKAELTSEEATLVSKYKVEREVLFHREAQGKNIPIVITVQSIMSGQTINSEDVTELLEAEERIKSACQSLHKLLIYMQSFGGEEVISI